MFLSLAGKQWLHGGMPCWPGQLPASLGTHAHLQLLSLEHNTLTGPLPAAWVDGWPAVVNSSLVSLYLHGNAFSGGFPAGLARAPYLTRLYMQNNYFRCCCWAPAALLSPAIASRRCLLTCNRLLSVWLLGVYEPSSSAGEGHG